MGFSGRIGLSEVAVVGRRDLCRGGVVEFAVEALLRVFTKPPTSEKRVVESNGTIFGPRVAPQIPSGFSACNHQQLFTVRRCVGA